MADEPATPQTTAADPAAPAAPAASAAPASGPWAQDIELVFNDPQVRAQVDSFLRSKIQPRMTQLEQEIAATENARNLWSAFQEDAPAAYAAITNELYGEEAATAALEALQQRLENAERSGAQQQGEQPPPQAPATDPRYEQMFTQWQQEQELKAYDAEIERVVNDPANADIDPNLLHSFVAAAEGDFDAAVVMYREDMGQRQAKLLETLDLTPEQLAQLNGKQDPPPVIGQEGGATPAATPTEADYRAQGLSPQEALHKAIEDATHATRRNSEAPPVS